MIILDFGFFRFKKIPACGDHGEPFIALEELVFTHTGPNRSIESGWNHIRYITKDDLKEIIPFFTNL